ncbi:unnamed protein product [Nippostrongylus brasiliensis]|uniref:Sideroflexin-2 (inferred by orthology to a human protein) n=1 Tax=Nippostrongylus brasiliensis TaxID=27835 RepID=A0A0N4YGX9_NIPBR|nr:unnamed protein product [Nippostrongylus brasiliensis]
MSFNPDQPRFDQSTFYGRLRHFAGITDPFIAFTPTADLLKAKSLMDKCRYKSTPAVVFWQWANQSFNALVNYTNRNAKSAMTTQDLLVAYTTAVGGALGLAVGLKQYFAKREVSALAQKMVPLAAVAVANAINIPLMRQKCIQGNTFSNMCNIFAVLTPIIMEALEKVERFKRHFNRLNIPTQLLLTFVIYGAMVPVGCGLFPQQNSIKLSTLKRFEPEAYERLKVVKGDRVYFNKGL